MITSAVVAPRLGLRARSDLQRLAGSEAEHHRASIVRTFERRGGIADAGYLLSLMRVHVDQPLSRLARHLVDRTALSFSWQGGTWLPLFQFDPTDLSIRPAVSRVLGQLVDVFDDWELAAWFAQPNSSLGTLSPLQAIAGMPDQVHEAARVDRFIARG